jgi:hypothetical protein
MPTSISRITLTLLLGASLFEAREPWHASQNLSDLIVVGVVYLFTEDNQPELLGIANVIFFL